jgi:hypothetical protein
VIITYMRNITKTALLGLFGLMGANALRMKEG